MIFGIRAPHAGRKRGPARGLTIIELVISMGVLGIGLMALTSSLLASVAHQQYAEAQTVATNHARDLLEQLEGVDETGEGAAYGMIELWNDIVAGIAPGAPQTLQNEVHQVLFYDPATPGTLLTQANMPGRWRPIVVEVIVNWTQGTRPVQIRLSTVVNPDPS